MVENKQNQEELKEFAEYQGKKLALLVSSLKLSNEEKQAMIEMAASASFEKLNQLVDYLEQQYLRETGSNIDDVLVGELEKWQKHYAKQDKQISKKTMSELNSIEKEINKFGE
ncbi:hypothetical protein ISR92_03020 [Patescibacteria group bacterium]|nr:hypothetical protein [Patescibacteria group bacterium]